MENKSKGLIIAVIVLALFGSLVFFLSKNEDQAAVKNTNTTQEILEEEVFDEIGDAGKIGPNEVALNDQNFEAQVENSTGVFLVDFYLTTCPHCQVVAPIVTEVSDELAGRAKVGKLEANSSPETSEKYNIQAVPTFIIFKDGQEVKTEKGAKSKEELLQLVENYL